MDLVSRCHACGHLAYLHGERPRRSYLDRTNRLPACLCSVARNGARRRQSALCACIRTRGEVERDVVARAAPILMQQLA